MVTGDVARVEGADPRLRVVVGLGGDGVGVVWWKDLLVVVVLEKVKKMELFLELEFEEGKRLGLGIFFCDMVMGEGVMVGLGDGR